MSSVDDRIVNMQFNNKQFETGVSQSAKSLSGLESTLSKTAQGKGLTNMAAGADGVRKKFSLMQVAGVAAVATLATKATLAGLAFVKSFTIDPIKAGWQEYNTNLKSIQTVMANTGKSIKPVQKALTELNEYSDQTIYNFSEMARNVGTFTAAGVGLKDSVSAIKGISNMAALSGSTSQQASSAMYQLSQAIAAGRVNLQDWNSVVNAGMGGKNLQSALIKTGIAMGTIDEKTVTWGKNIKIAGASFRESISAKNGAEPWLTSGVLVKAFALMDGRLSSTAIKANLLAKNLKLPANEQLSATEITKKANVELDRQQELMKKQGFSPEQIKSLTSMANRAYESATVLKTFPQLVGVVRESLGSVWATAFTGIVGNFTESKKLWTAAGAAVMKGTQALNLGLTNLISGWKTGIDGISGRQAVIDGVKNAFEALSKVLGIIKGAFTDVFPPGAGSGLARISIGFRDLMAALVPTAPTMEKLRSIFGGVFAVLHIGWTIIKTVAGAFGQLFGAIFQGTGPATGGILTMLASVGEAIKSFDKWLSSGSKIEDFLKRLASVAGPVFAPLVRGIQLVVNAFEQLASGKGIEGFAGPFKAAKETFAQFGNTVKSALGGLAPLLSGVGDALRSAFSNIPGADIAVGIVMGIIKGLGGAALGLIRSAATTLANAIPDSIKNALGIASPAYELIPVGINIVKGIIVGIMQAIPEILSAAGSMLMSIISGVQAAGPKIASAFKQLFGDFDALDFAATFNALLTGGLLVMLMRFGKSANSFTKIFTDVTDGVTKSLSAMQGALKAQTLKAIAIAVALLVGSIIALSFIEPKKIAISLGAIAAMMTLLVGSMAALSKLASGEVNMAVLAVSIALISGAMINLAAAVAILGNQDMATLAKGLGAMSIVMAIMVRSMQGLAMLGPGLPAAAAGIAIVSAAMVVLAGAVLAFGSMDIATLAVGIGAMAFAMSILTGALSTLVVLGPGVASAGAGLLLASTSMAILAGAVLAFGSMDLQTLAVGMGAVAIAMGIFVTSLSLLGSIGPAVLAGGAAMVLMATAMGMLVPVIAALGSMPWDVLKQGLIGLALAMGIFVVGLALLGVVAKVFGGALLMLGAALALAGVGMLAFGTGFALLAATGVAGVAVLIAAFSAFMALLPSLAVQVAASFVVFVETIAKAAPRVRKAMSTIIKEMLGVVKDAIPQIGAIIQQLLDTALSILQSSGPRWIAMGFQLIDKFLQSAAKHAPSIIKSATKLITTFMDGIGNASGRIADSAAKMIVKFVNATADAIRNNAGALGRAGLNLATAIIDGLTGGLLGRGIQMVQNAASRLADAIPGPIKKILGIASPSKEAYYWGQMIGEGLSGGINDSIRLAVGAAVALANAVLSAGNSAVLVAQEKAREKQIAADRLLASSEAAKYAASRSKRGSSLRRSLTRTASARKKDAEAAQKDADDAKAAMEKVKAFEDADLKGKGAFKATDAQEASDTASRLLARAAAQAKEAVRIRTKNRKASNELLQKAKDDAARAKVYADRAQTYDAESKDYYARDVNDRISQIEALSKAEENAKKAEAELNAADGDGKVAILLKRAEVNQAKADAAAASALALIEQAKSLASTDAAQSMALLDQSEAQAKLAQESAEKAKAEREQALQGIADAANQVVPSRTVLEDAASVVDRYTASLASASEAAQATPQPIQYTQNNYSPVALSASEIYRQNKNLLSLQEVKMGVKTP